MHPERLNMFSAARRAVALLSLALAIDARADQITVDVGGNDLIFSPAVFSITTADTVTFVNKGGFHNVAADDGSFRCAAACDGDGSGKDGSASADLWSFSVRYPDPGVFGFHCQIHGIPGAGMFGTVTVVQAVAQPPPTTDAAPLSAIALLLIAGGLIACTTLVRYAPQRVRAFGKMQRVHPATNPQRPDRGET